MKHKSNITKIVASLCMVGLGGCVAGGETDEAPDELTYPYVHLAGTEAAMVAKRSGHAATLDEQLAEAEVRAALVAELDPGLGNGWVADGVATFATPRDHMIEEDAKNREPRSDGPQTREAILVLADGRRFRQSGDAVDWFTGRGAGPSEVEGADQPDKAQIGTDDRSTISYNSYSAYPSRAVGSILGSQYSSSGFCTGSLIGPRLVVTAGHCIYDGSNWLWNTWFSPGHRGRGIDRFPNGAPRRVVGLLSIHGWVVDGNPHHDIGFMILEDRPETASLGWFGFGWWTNLQNVGVGIYQYPGWNYSCAASPTGSLCDNYQYWGWSYINNQCGNLVEHQVDTNPGSSGSPTYRWWGGGRWVVGPHAYGFSPCQYGDNKAVILGQYRSQVACDLFEDFPSIYAQRSC